MKKILLLSMLLGSVGAWAQTTYNSTDFATAGDVIGTTLAGNLLGQPYAQSGPAQNWDFSSLTTDSTEDVTWLNPNNTGYKTTWCFVHLYIFNCNSQFSSAFNLAGLVTEGFSLDNLGVTNVINHYRLTSTSLQSKMIGATVDLTGTPLPITVDYTVPDVVYDFPIQYNDDYTHTSQLSINLSSFGLPVSIDGTNVRHNQVNGWGSLTTPAGTYASVLKMKTTLVTDQSIVYNGETIPLQVTTVTYSWFDPAYGIPVLQASGTEAAGQFVPAQVRFLGTALGVRHDDFAGIALYPNPTSGRLQLNAEVNVYEVSVFDTLGNKVGNSLDISGLSTGMYFVKVTTDGGSFVRKVIKK